MDVKQKFLELTKRTYPHGHEHELIDQLPNFLKSDEFGNLYHQIGENPTTMFTCHLDTASHDQVDVKHVIEGDMIQTDGTSILGADDKAGVVVLLYLIEQNVEGLYYFFLGEERGCVGSRKVSSKHKTYPLENINKVVSFDRRGYDSVITHQLSGRSCSNEFATDLSNKLNKISDGLIDKPFYYRPDPTGIYTDSAQFVDIYSECTNISVGYHNEHSGSESQNIKHLEDLCLVVSKIDWDNLLVSRKVGTGYYDYYNDYEYEYSIRNSYLNENKSDPFDDDLESSDFNITEVVLDDEFYGYESTIQYNNITKEIINVKLHQARIVQEKHKIDNLLHNLEISYDSYTWDGNTLVIKLDTYQNICLTRKEVTDYISEINDWIHKEISDKRKYYI